MRPLVGADNQTMFHGVVVYIVNMSVEVILTPDKMIPESVLPDTPASDVQPVAESGREGKLQATHDLGRVVSRRFNHAVKVVRQNHPSDHVKCAASSGCLNGKMEQIDMIHRQGCRSRVTLVRKDRGCP